jgi:hypothetical protein
MNVIVQDPERHLRLPTRHAGYSTQTPFRFGWRWWWIRRSADLMPCHHPRPRRRCKINDFRIPQRLILTALSIRYQHHTLLCLRQLQIQWHWPPHHTSAYVKRSRDSNALITRLLRRRRPCCDLRLSPVVVRPKASPSSCHVV